MNIFNLTKTKGTQFLHNTKVPVNISLTKIPAFLRSPEEIFYRNDPLGANDLCLECSGNLRIITAKMQDLLLCFSPKKLCLYKFSSPKASPNSLICEENPDQINTNVCSDIRLSVTNL